MSSALSVSAISGFQASPQPTLSPLVTIFAIQTETAHPTWIVTLPNTEAELTTTLHDMLLLTRNWEASTESIRLSTTDTALPNTSSTSILAPLATSSSTENLASPTIAGTSYSDVSSSMDVPPMPSTSTSTLQPSPPVEETAYTRSSISPTTVATTPSPSRPSTSPIVGIVTNASISGGPTHTFSPSVSTLSTSSKAGIIAGSTLGGCAIIALLFAIIFYIRRKRSQNHLTEQQHLHPSITPPSQSLPTLPASMSQPSTILTIRPGRHAYSDPDSSLDSMYLRHEHLPMTTSHESMPPPSSAEILPSRIASFYSTSTWDGGYGSEGYWDVERGTLTKHDSMRSNPFDLEPPLNVHPGTARL